jgi:hypothetical protein
MYQLMLGCNEATLLNRLHDFGVILTSFKNA